eukprot:TRINITY_DN5826_c0_g1_i1.p1 TRINITY_DN5826_c0_g1~~TRINITY_DN5826_c0_g1_i1.p1  ORF type:complete len:299 (-),score=57.04 TRINITY_DN5826_c0_g1_i1:53-949(-)
MNQSDVQAKKYHKKSQPITPSSPTSPFISPSHPIPHISFLTYNVWFSGKYFKERHTRIFQIIEEENPDFVCLQEVVPGFIEDFIAKNQKILNTYYVSDITGDTVGSYGVVILSKFKPFNLQLVPLESYMDRSLLMAEFLINDEIFAVGTVHLESLAMASRRRAQLITISDIMSSNFKHWTIMGDFNFDNERNFNKEDKSIPLENKVLEEIMPNAKDVWLSLFPDSPSSGKTFDVTINKMLSANEPVMRYDRIMLQSPTWHPVSAKLVGTEQIQTPSILQKNHQVWPSDHFGVLAVLSI